MLMTNILGMVILEFVDTYYFQIKFRSKKIVNKNELFLQIIQKIYV